MRGLHQRSHGGLSAIPNLPETGSETCTGRDPAEPDSGPCPNPVPLSFSSRFDGPGQLAKRDPRGAALWGRSPGLLPIEAPKGEESPRISKRLQERVGTNKSSAPPAHPPPRKVLPLQEAHYQQGAPWPVLQSQPRRRL